MLRARELWIVGLRERCLEVQRRLLAAREQRLEATKRRRRRRGTDPDAVLRDDVERQHALVHQRREDVGHQLVERGAVVDAKRRQRVVADLEIADDPAEGVVGMHSSRDLPSAADAGRDRVQPQHELHVRRQRLAPGLALDRFDAAQELAQVERADDVPQPPSRMRRRQGVRRHLEPDHRLVALRLRDSWLALVTHASETNHAGPTFPELRSAAID